MAKYALGCTLQLTLLVEAASPTQARIVADDTLAREVLSTAGPRMKFLPMPWSAPIEVPDARP